MESTPQLGQGGSRQEGSNPTNHATRNPKWDGDLITKEWDVKVCRVIELMTGRGGVALATSEEAIRCKEGIVQIDGLQCAVITPQKVRTWMGGEEVSSNEITRKGSTEFA